MHFWGVRKSLSNPIGSDSVSELVWRRSAAAARIPPGPKFSSQVQFFSLRATPKTGYSWNLKRIEGTLFFTQINLLNRHILILSQGHHKSKIVSLINIQFWLMKLKLWGKGPVELTSLSLSKQTRFFINFSSNEDLSGLKAILCKRGEEASELFFLFLTFFHHEGNTLSVSTFQLRLQRWWWLS